MALAEFIVTFREFFEISLVVGIMLAYLYKTGNGKLGKYVWAGVGLAMVASVLAYFAFQQIEGGFAANDTLFEGATLVIAAGLVTWLLVWMRAQKNLAESIRAGLRQSIDSGQKAGVLLFAFIAVFREGIEVIIFLAGIGIANGGISLAWAMAGALVSVALTYAVLRHMVKLDFGTFFNVTGVMLIFLAAGLLSQGVAELQEAHLLPPLVEHIYDITPAMNADGTYALMHENGAIGGILKSLVGYNTGPSLLQALVYAGYLGLAYFSFWKASARSS
jgi:high-affinity iron transporter